MPALAARSAGGDRGGAAQHHGQGQPEGRLAEAQAALLALLRAACRNPVTLEAAAGDKRLLAAAVRLLGCREGAVVGEAAQLLHLVSSCEPGRREAAAALAAQRCAGFARLLGMLPGAPPVTQVGVQL
jgi:hypothetical protein